MTKKDFQFIADVLWDLRHEPAADQNTLQMVVREFARQLSRTNSRFDGDRFIAAANYRR